MARQLRVTVPGYPHHIIQRGNNRQLIVHDDEDRERLLASIREQATAAQVALHGYVLMSNHLHLLATPATAEGVPRMMQALGRRYVAHFKSAFPQPLVLNRDYLVTYAGRGQAVAETGRVVPSMGHDANAPVEMAKRLLGPQTLITQNISSGVFRGVIVGETEQHFVQRISSKLAAVHEKARMPLGLQVGDAGTLRYRGGKAGFEPMKEIERGRGGLTR